MRSVLFALLAFALAACNSPGVPYHYQDLKVLPVPTSLPLAPLVTDAVTVSFAIFNTDNAPQANVVWRIYEDSPVGTPTGGTLISDNTITSLGGFEQAAQTLPLAAPGVPTRHTYTVVVDPDNLIVERDETNNSATATVSWADYDLSYLPAPTFTPVNPLNSDQITVSFSIVNTSSLGGSAPSTNVTCQVFELDTTTLPPAVPAAPVAVTIVGGTAQPVPVAAGATVPVTLVLPATTAGTHTYQIVLVPDVIDSNEVNNSANIVVVVGVPG